MSLFCRSRSFEKKKRKTFPKTAWTMCMLSCAPKIFKRSSCNLVNKIENWRKRTTKELKSQGKIGSVFQFLHKRFSVPEEQTVQRNDRSLIRSVEEKARLESVWVRTVFGLIRRFGQGHVPMLSWNWSGHLYVWLLCIVLWWNNVMMNWISSIGACPKSELQIYAGACPKLELQRIAPTTIRSFRNKSIKLHRIPFPREWNN